jgi:hypothetical protein
MMQFWIPAGGNNAGGFHQAEIMQILLPAGGNDAVLTSNRRKCCSFGFSRQK